MDFSIFLGNAKISPIKNCRFYTSKRVTLVVLVSFFTSKAGIAVFFTSINFLLVKEAVFTSKGY